MGWTWRGVRTEIGSLLLVIPIVGSDLTRSGRQGEERSTPAPPTLTFPQELPEKPLRAYSLILTSSRSIPRRTSHLSASTVCNLTQDILCM